MENMEDSQERKYIENVINIEKRINMIKEKNKLHLTDFFYEHIENLLNKYKALRTPNQDPKMLGEVTEDIDTIDDSVEELIDQEKIYGINLENRKTFINSIEGDLYSYYFDIQCGDDLVGLLKEY